MKQVLILGASGRIGRHTERAFANAGWKIRRFNRKKDDMVSAANGCDVIVNGMNPPNYQNWKETIPKITAEVIKAAKVNNATVIIPGNVYHFGNTPGIWSEHTPPVPVSRKGQIRLEMERAYARSGVQTIILRAGNFIDPDLQGCAMAMVYLRSIKQGKVTLPAPAEIRQAMCFLPDWARACVALAEIRQTLGQFEDIPFAGHTISAADIRAEAERQLGRTIKFTHFPWWAMRLSAPFWELARELNEMRYLWNTDHALSDARLKVLLPDFKTTPFEKVMESVLADELAKTGTVPVRAKA